MSKKHFVALADSLRCDLFLRTPFTAEQRQAIVRTLADFCKSQNANFNRERWLSYIAGECGPNGGAR